MSSDPVQQVAEGLDEGADSGPVPSLRLALISDEQHQDSGLDALLREAGAELCGCATIEELQLALKEQVFDIVVLDEPRAPLERVVELLYQARTLDFEPSFLVLLEDPSVEAVSDLYRHGCARVILKREMWEEEYILALDQILRLRRLKEENLRLQAQLTQANILLEEKNQRLDDFSASVAHDIRGPLGSIAMRLEYIRDTFPDDIEGRLNQIIDRTLQSSYRLTDLVQGMYEFAKLGRTKNDREEIELKEFVPEILSDLDFEREEQIQIGVEELPKICGSRALLQRVFLNLVTNAVKYNDKEQVLINIGFAGTEKRFSAPFAKIFVEDNGPGIPPEYQQDIFKMFGRGEQDTSTEGLGIGLNVVKKIIELHYGEIEVFSEVGKGTRFTFSLPMQPIHLA